MKYQKKHTKILLDDLPKEIKELSFSSAPNKEEKSESLNTNSLLSLAEVEYRHVINTLNQLGGNKSQTARILGIDRKTLDRILKRNLIN